MKTLKDLKGMVSGGQLEEVFKSLLLIGEQYDIPYNKDIFHTSARLNLLNRDRQNNVISNNEFNIERNSIILSVLEIITHLSNLDLENFIKKHNLDDVKAEIEKLANDFEQCDGIKSTPSRLRTKNHIMRQIGERMIATPLLVDSYKSSKKEGIICAIANKIKTLPDSDSIVVLECIAINSKKNFVKGEIVNALAEVIYSGQLRIGDDERIESILDVILDEFSDIPLQNNIHRVRADLHFLTGKIK